MPSIQDRITTQETKLKQLQAKRRQIKSRMRAIESKKKRSEDIRRKTLIGQVVLATIKSQPEDARQNDLRELDALLDATPTSAADRELFDLPVRPAGQPVTPPDQSISRADDPDDDIIMFPYGFDPWDDITDAEVKPILERMGQTRREVAISALKKAFSDSFFDVCPLDAITGYGEKKPANTLLDALHCANFEQIPMDDRVILYRAAMRCVREHLAHKCSVTLEFSDFPFPERLRPSASLKADFTPTGPAPELDPCYFQDILPILKEAWLDPDPVLDLREMATPQKLAALQQAFQQMPPAECPEPVFHTVPSKKGAYVKQKRVVWVVLESLAVILLLVLAAAYSYTVPLSPQPLPNEVTPHAPAPSSAH